MHKISLRLHAAQAQRSQVSRKHTINEELMVRMMHEAFVFGGQYSENEYGFMKRKRVVMVFPTTVDFGIDFVWWWWWWKIRRLADDVAWNVDTLMMWHGTEL